jgi:hypothetical protein
MTRRALGRIVIPLNNGFTAILAMCLDMTTKHGSFSGLSGRELLVQPKGHAAARWEKLPVVKCLVFRRLPFLYRSSTRGMGRVD